MASKEVTMTDDREKWIVRGRVGYVPSKRFENVSIGHAFGVGLLQPVGPEPTSMSEHIQTFHPFQTGYIPSNSSGSS